MNLPKVFNPSGWKLTPKILMAFLLTSVLPVLAASVFTLNYFYAVSFDTAQNNLGKELKTVRHFLDERAQRLVSDTRWASRENVVALNLSLGLTAPVLAYLDTFRVERHLAVALLLDNQGHPLGGQSPGSPSPALLSGVTPDRLEQARTRNGTSFPPAPVGGGVLILALVPVSDDLGVTSHYLLVGLDLGAAEPGSFLEEVQQVVSGPVVLLGNAGLVATNPDSPRWDGALRWPTSNPGAGGLFPAKADGVTYLFGFEALGEPGAGATAWVGVSFSLDQFQRRANSAAGGLVLLALLCVSLSCLAAVAFSRALTRPLLKLARQASAWTGGQGGHRLEVTTQDETGNLGQAFNEVLDRLDGTLYSLRKTQNYLKNIFNSLTSVLVSVDETGAIQEWNIAAERFNGTKAPEAVGRKVWELSPVFQGLEDLLDRAVTTREPQFLKKELGRGHDQRTYDLCLYPLVWNGVSGVVIRMDDITDSQRKDRQLQQAQKMETVGTLTEGIAHNFNNLLTGITGTVSLVNLDLRLGGPVDPDLLRLRMGMIEESTRKASEIVRRLMGLSRGSSGEFGPVDLAAVVTDITKTGQMVLDKSVEVEVTGITGPAFVYGDRSQLEQSLLNLVINASHAMTIMRSRGEHTGGTVRVSLVGINAVNDFLASHPEAVRSDYWLLQVKDGGVGIEDENMKKIFDPFFTTKEIGKGSGLGLAMVYATVRQHNGLIDIYSEVGRGTTVSLYFPVLASASVPVVPVTDPWAPADLFRGQGLVLVVDDELVVQTTARMILEACGYEVVTADNGLEALAVFQARAREVRAVILDSSMPKLSGAETLVGLRALDPEVKVVLSSGLLAEVPPSDDPRAAHLRFLPKPYSLAELSQALHDLLEGPP